MPSVPAILIVEDDAVTSELVKAQLGSLGYLVSGVVTTGEEAVAWVDSNPPDLVLMDVGLAGAIDGVAAATILRSRSPVPVVFLTSKSDRETLERIQGTAPFGFLLKPPRKEEIGTAISVALRGKEMELRAQHSEDRLAAILDGIVDAVIAVDGAGRVTFMNSQAALLGGRPEGQGVGGAAGELFAVVDSRDEAGRAVAFAWDIAGEGRSTREPTLLTLRRNDGAERHVRATVSPLRDGGAVFLLHDLTQRRAAEAEMRRMARGLKVLSESGRALQRAADEAALLDDVCRIVVELGGYRLAWVGMADSDPARSIRPVAQAGYRDRHLEGLHLSWAAGSDDQSPTGEAIRSGAVVVARDILEDDRYSDWRLEAAKRGYASGIALPLSHGGQTIGALTIYAIEADAFDTDEMGLLRELSLNLSYGIQALRTRGERHRAERDLLKAEARYRTLVEQIPVVTYIAALDDLNSMLYLSPQIAGLTGFTPDRWISNPAFFVNRLYPADRVRVLGELAHSKQSGAPLKLEYRLVASDGRTVWVGDEAKVVQDDQGRPQFVHGVITDITSRKLTEESLKQALATLRALVTASPLAVCMLDPRGQVTTVWNPAAERMFGWRADEVMGRRLPIVGADQQEDFDRLCARVLAGETLIGVEMQRYRRDGTPIHVSLALSPLVGDDARIEYLVAMVADVTERRRAEVALVAAQRDATVGRMAAVVAHEVNNPLAAIKAWLGLLRSDLARQPEVTKHLELIGHQVDRIARTMRNLLGFSRQREVQDLRVPASLLISTVAELFVGRMQAKGIRFDLAVPDQLPAVRGDVDQLQEVLINLLENACQALGSGDQVTLRAELIGQFIEICIEDDGPGLSGDPEKLFTPFYTTKVNGTGLGLTVARRICEAHGGRLTAANVPSGGACFRIRLPILADAGADGAMAGGGVVPGAAEAEDER
jgi:PAS domain S-box-containing protein